MVPPSRERSGTTWRWTDREPRRSAPNAHRPGPWGRKPMTVPQTVPGRRADTDDTRDEAVEAAVELSAEDLDAQSPAADLVRVYLNGIGKTALLTAADEVELAKRIEAGVFAQHMIDSADKLTAKRRSELTALVRDGYVAKNHLLEANLRLVVS